MFKIRNVEINNPIIVGPMAGISNSAFRDLCYEFNCGLVYGEMISDKAIFYNNNHTREMLVDENNNHPLTFQLFGSELSTMVYAAKVLDNETNCDIIDINMGCPVGKVIKTGAGCAMMLDEDNTTKIVSEIIKNVKKPVTVKMRLGYAKTDLNYLSLSKKLQDVGVSAIALHARTRTQLYEGQADWSYIKILKDNLSIPVIGNGDVKCVDDYLNMIKQTGCDGVMISRATLGNPFLIKEINYFLNKNIISPVTNDDKFNYCLKHAKKLVELKGEKIGIGEMRGIAPHYINGMYNSTKYKEKMNHINTYDDLENIINEYRSILID